jgi:hypothetical protein
MAFAVTITPSFKVMDSRSLRPRTWICEFFHSDISDKYAK